MSETKKNIAKHTEELEDLIEFLESPLGQRTLWACQGKLTPEETGYLYSEELQLAITLVKLSALISEHEVKKLKKGICCYVREELGNMNFENDEEAISYMVSFGENNKI